MSLGGLSESVHARTVRLTTSSSDMEDHSLVMRDHNSDRKRSVTHVLGTVLRQWSVGSNSSSYLNHEGGDGESTPLAVSMMPGDVEQDTSSH